MAKHSVNVIVKARDEASRKFLRIGGAAQVMGRMFKGVGGMIKTTLVTALKAAKYAAVGLGVAMAGATYKAIQQQAAEVELASALKVTGQYSEAALQRLKDQATAIQDVTVHGDEYILTLMRMAITLGVTEDKAADAAKAAIALYEGFGGGRGKPAIFLRYYIDALRGTGSSLESYVGELRKAKTEGEKQIILQQALTRGWDVSTSKAEHAGGALKQMKNKLGDVAEIIAWPLLPVITKSAHAITKWAQENVDRIGWWADKTFAYVTLIKDVFWDFVVFMREDWRAGLTFVFNSFLELLKATFKSAVILAIAGGKGIWKGVKEGLLGGDDKALKQKMDEIDKRKERIYRAYELEWEKGGRRTPFEPPPESRWLEYDELRALAEKELLQSKTKGIIGTSLKAAMDTFAEAVDKIAADMPESMKEGLKKAKAKLEKRLEELGEMPPKGRAGELARAAAPSIFSMAGIADLLKKTRTEAIQRLAPREARFLTFAPGARFGEEYKYQIQTANNTKQLVRFFKESLQKMKEIARGIQKLTQKNPLLPEISISSFK